LPLFAADLLCLDLLGNFEEARMKKTEWIRETLSAWPSPDYQRQKEAEGWRLVAIEWEREIEAEAERGERAQPAEEIPYGMRIAADCHHLEESPSEMQVLKFLAELIVQDASFTAMADALNMRGFRTRDAHVWTAAGVFKLTPRLIEIAPKILSGQEWESRKKQFSRVTWNS
jgi:hypothetical protein